jgi:hypothetical protein
MIKLMYLISCDDTIVDEKTNKISCIGLVDEIEASVFPTCFGIALVIGLTGIKEGKTEKITLEIQKNQKSFASASGDVIGSRKNGTVDIIVDLKEAPINEAGVYSFIVKDSKNEVLGKRALLVKSVQREVQKVE